MPDPLPPDRCPGVLRPHLAADGALLRIRIPGGRAAPSTMAALRRMSSEFGDGDLHLTSRGNLQIRGIPAGSDRSVPESLVNSVVEAGLLPSPSHERVRNIVASPLSGVVGGRMDVRPVVAALDRALCADPLLADLPGRFLFGIDDGRSDLDGLPCDLGVRAVGAASARVRVDRLPGPLVERDRIVPVLTGLARRFLGIRADLWNVRQLPGKGRELLDGEEFDDSGDGPPASGTEYRGDRPGEVHGVFAVSDSEAAVAGSVPLGILTPRIQDALVESAAHDSGAIILTPWRGAVVAPVRADRADRVAESLSRAGLVVDPDSPWTRISACAGSPGCSRSRGDTRSHATALARRLAGPGSDRSPVHVVGCERACGAPRGPHSLVLAGGAP
ncbi:precorrin-3B synthase [Actinorugispora endophytica]|uniref:precorrin-3B synthase n=1 Tax=Actinorugispora endophytica TaxID=1605990 RepID=UPI001AAD7C9A|nr:precorrin-3B synthase [Actinorugispora endophytica]